LVARHAFPVPERKPLKQAHPPIPVSSTSRSRLRIGSAAPPWRKKPCVEHEWPAIVAHPEPAEHRQVIFTAEVDLGASGDVDLIGPSEGGGKRTLEDRHLARPQRSRVAGKLQVGGRGGRQFRRTRIA